MTKQQTFTILIFLSKSNFSHIKQFVFNSIYLLDKEKRPKLLIQINSIDSYERHRIEGYTFIDIPTTNTGSFTIESKCFKPKEDSYMSVFSYFLGGSRKISDIKEIIKTSSKNEFGLDCVLNRYGIQTEYTGKITVNLNVVVQNKEVADNAKKKVRRSQERDVFSLNNEIEKSKEMMMRSSGNVSESVLVGESYVNNSVMSNTIKTKDFGLINRFSG